MFPPLWLVGTSVLQPWWALAVGQLMASLCLALWSFTLHWATLYSGTTQGDPCEAQVHLVCVAPLEISFSILLLWMFQLFCPQILISSAQQPIVFCLGSPSCSVVQKVPLGRKPGWSDHRAHLICFPSLEVHSTVLPAVWNGMETVFFLYFIQYSTYVRGVNLVLLALSWTEVEGPLEKWVYHWNT